MTHIKALKLARDCIRDSVEYKQGKATAIEAVDDIDEALAQPQQEPPFSVQQAYAMAQVCLDLHETLGCKWGDNPYLAIAGLREAQPQQEPVAWITHNAGLYHFKPDQSLEPLPLFLAPPPCPTCEALARTVMMDQTGRNV